MRIDFQYPPQPADPERTLGQNDDAANCPPSPAAVASTGEDLAQLSGARAQVASLTAQASQLPEIRQERVEALRQALADKRYLPDLRNVAGAMLEWMLQRPADLRKI